MDVWCETPCWVFTTSANQFGSSLSGWENMFGGAGIEGEKTKGEKAETKKGKAETFQGTCRVHYEQSLRQKHVRHGVNPHSAAGPEVTSDQQVYEAIYFLVLRFSSGGWNFFFLYIYFWF